MDLTHDRGIQSKTPPLQFRPVSHPTQDGLQGQAGRRLGAHSSGIECQFRKDNWVRCLQFSFQSIDILTTISSYEIYWFKEGTFERIGDGGWLNVSDSYFHGVCFVDNSARLKVGIFWQCQE